MATDVFVAAWNDVQAIADVLYAQREIGGVMLCPTGRILRAFAKANEAPPTEHEKYAGVIAGLCADVDANQARLQAAYSTYVSRAKLTGKRAEPMPTPSCNCVGCQLQRTPTFAAQWPLVQ